MSETLVTRLGDLANRMESAVRTGEHGFDVLSVVATAREAADTITTLRLAASLRPVLRHAEEEAKRRLVHLATSNADDWRWYQNQARQACRALKIEVPTELDW